MPTAWDFTSVINKYKVVDFSLNLLHSYYTCWVFLLNLTYRKRLLYRILSNCNWKNIPTDKVHSNGLYFFLKVTLVMFSLVESLLKHFNHNLGWRFYDPVCLSALSRRFSVVQCQKPRLSWRPCLLLFQFQLFQSWGPLSAQTPTDRFVKKIETYPSRDLRWKWTFGCYFVFRVFQMFFLFRLGSTDFGSTSCQFCRAAASLCCTRWT